MTDVDLIIDIDPLPQSLLALRDELPKTLYDAMKEQVEPRGIQLVQEQIFDTDAIAGKDFLHSWRSMTVFGGNGRSRNSAGQFSSDSKIETTIFSIDEEEKVTAIEWGRPKGHWEPPTAIRAWIDVRGLEPDDPSTTKDQFAFLINRHIHDEGIKGRFPIETARILLDEEIYDLVLSYLDRHLKE